MKQPQQKLTPNYKRITQFFRNNLSPATIHLSSCCCVTCIPSVHIKKVLDHRACPKLSLQSASPAGNFGRYRLYEWQQVFLPFPTPPLTCIKLNLKTMKDA
ncbi:hypothetical protein P5673_022446 [Acropora cervicornis]|uniref:Uncharacterized protein n=1 Tax=Acropora cervicornis TaxID=6130 RepID=A0AAD9Q6R4_ACRCE|nr:hypothetical protein P5673_022446 [Acropora cervicornis]